MNVAEYVVYCLALYKIKLIFGYPGSPILPLMNAIQKNPKLRWVLVRHEYSAALAASAHAKLTGQISVCMASSGPGATNMITGLIDANTDRVPVLAITGLLPTRAHGLSHFQDADQVHIYKTICGLSIACEQPYQIEQMLEYVLGYAIKNRCVAHLAIPVDIQQAVIPPTPHKIQKNITLMQPPTSATDFVAKKLKSLENIVIAVGPRARGTGENIIKMAMKLKAPIICSFAGKGVIDESHPNYFGVLGLYGAPANKIAMEIIRDAKVIIAIGIDDLFYFLTHEKPTQQRELIQFDNDISMISPLFVQKYVLLGDLKEMLAHLTKKITARSTKFLENAVKIRETLTKADNNKIVKSKAKTVHQKFFLEKLNKFIDHENTTLVFDIGDNAAWALKYLRLTKKQDVLVSNRIGTMGFCLCGVIAAKLARPTHRVVGITGDGGFQMVMGELYTAIQNKLNVIIIIFNNGILQRVLAQQSKAYGVELFNPDFELLARASSALCVQIDNESEIDSKLKQAFAVKDKTVLINVKCDPKIFAELTTWN